MNIKIPEGMLKAVSAALAEHWKERTLADGSTVDVALEAALRWLSENPIVPSEADVMEILQERFESHHISGEEYCAIPPATVRFVIRESQRRMFLAPEPTEEKDGTVLWKAGTTIPVGVWANGKLYPTSEKDEPKVPEKIKDLLLPDIESGFFKPEVVNERMAESFSRGYDEGYSQGHSDRSRETFG